MRIVVTGMGVVSPAGCSVASFWKSVCEGRSFFRAISRFPVSDFQFARAGEITDFQWPSDLGPPPEDWASRFVMAAAREAVHDAALAGMQGTGVVLATNFGGVGAASDFMAWALGRKDGNGGTFPELSFQIAADRVAQVWNFRGPRLVISLSCASGASAIAQAADLIRAGRARSVIAGGYDALSPFAWAGLSVLRTMSRDAVRPFDLRRDGTIFSEGSGVLAVEEMEFARARGAHIYAELLGYGMNNNAFHMTAPAKEGAGTAAVMRAALLDAGINPSDIDHINAHGTGTKSNDVTETQAIKAVFGEHARRIPITSIKSSLGHMMGAAGSVEAIASLLTLRDGIIPPTINYEHPDPECDLDYVTNTAIKADVRLVLSNSAGIGGCNTALIFKGAWR